MNDSSPSLSAYADPTVMRHVLTTSHSIAVVGLSPRPDRPSHQVAIFLKAHGYRVIPVNPMADEILGERCFPDLQAIGEPVDLVNVFRNPADCPEIAAQAVASGARALWLQIGVISVEAARTAAAAGLAVVMDRCTKIEHERLLRTDPQHH